MQETRELPGSPIRRKLSAYLQEKLGPGYSVHDLFCKRGPNAGICTVVENFELAGKGHVDEREIDKCIEEFYRSLGFHKTTVEEADVPDVNFAKDAQRMSLIISHLGDSVYVTAFEYNSRDVRA